MKRAGKIFVIMLIAVCMSVLCACKSTQSAHELTGDEFWGEGIAVLNREHEQIKNSIRESNRSMDYEQLFILYSKVQRHVINHGCGLLYNNYELYREFLTSMLYGSWLDKNGVCRLKFVYYYMDYNNTSGRAQLWTDIPNSMQDGSENVYYYDFESERLIVGYQNKETSKKTVLFNISFYQDHIELINLYDHMIYSLVLDNGSVKEVKGYAEKAYRYISESVYRFSENPRSVKVLQCEVSESSVCAEIYEKDYLGTSIVNTYYFYQTDGVCYWERNNRYISSNIDVEELNRKLREYLK